MNVSQEQEAIDVETMRNALSGSLAALSQAIPSMATQGQDPSDVVHKIASVIDMRRKGTMIEDAVLQAFAPAPTPAVPEQQMSADQMLAAMGGNQPAPAPGPTPEGPLQEPTQPAGPTQPTPPAGLAGILAGMGGGQ